MIDCLPSEVLLDALCCLDFNTLLSLRFVNAFFCCLTEKNSSRLAQAKKLHLCVEKDKVEFYSSILNDIVVAPFDTTDNASVTSAMSQIITFAGLHPVETLSCRRYLPSSLLQRVLNSVPAAKYTGSLYLQVSQMSCYDSDQRRGALRETLHIVRTRSVPGFRLQRALQL